MWLTKGFIMNSFAAEVKEGNYKRIDYQIWRNLRDATPEEWDINLEARLTESEKPLINAVVSWEHRIAPYEFRIDDKSFGGFLYDLLKPHLNNLCYYDSSGLEYVKRDDTCFSATNKIDSLAEKTTEYDIKIRKENDSMNLFKNFDFGTCENDNVKMSIYGVAVKNANGTWVSYDSKSSSVIDVDIFNFNAKYLYKIPAAIKDIKVGDTIIHNRKPMFVTGVDEDRLLVIDPAAGEEKIIIPTNSMFGFDFVVRVVNLFGDAFNGTSADAPFGNMLPLMMLADDGKTDDMLPLMFAMGGGKIDMSNPMMLYFLMKNGDKSNDMLPLYFFMNGSYFGPSNPKTCDCDNRTYDRCDCDNTSK